MAVAGEPWRCSVGLVRCPGAARARAATSSGCFTWAGSDPHRGSHHRHGHGLAVAVVDGAPAGGDGPDAVALRAAVGDPAPGCMTWTSASRATIATPTSSMTSASRRGGAEADGGPSSRRCRRRSGRGGRSGGRRGAPTAARARRSSGGGAGLRGTPRARTGATVACAAVGSAAGGWFDGGAATPVADRGRPAGWSSS